MVLIGAIEAARVLGMTSPGVYKMRISGVLKPARVKPYRFELATVEALRASREGKPKHGRKIHGVEITTKGAS